MKDHTGCIRGFHFSSRAWYAEANKRAGIADEINFGMYSLEGGTTGEMNIRWHNLGKKDCPRLDVFDDAWSALYMFSDLLKAMSERDSDNITPDAFAELLLEHDFKDLTAYESPYKDALKDTKQQRLLALESEIRQLRHELTD